MANPLPSDGRDTVFDSRGLDQPGLGKKEIRRFWKPEIDGAVPSVQTKGVIEGTPDLNYTMFRALQGPRQTERIPTGADGPSTGRLL